MSATVRFAPSPTGYIHIGNARTALFNDLLAKKTGGQFILRFDDTDTERSRTEYADAIAEDLGWLGIVPDRVERQSARIESYDAVAEDLKSRGLLYPCYETADELERRRRLQRARGLPPVYDRAALLLSDEERAAFEAEGRKPHWRFLLPNFDSDPKAIRRTDVTWTDLCRGEQSVDIGSLSDPVLVREDGSYLYTLPSVVDDIDMGVNHVVRGDDHVTNTAVQIALFKALGAEPAHFAHHNLLTTASGEGLSKRVGSLSIRSLRDEGYEPMAVASLAVLIGTSEAVHAYRSLEDLTEHFDLAGVSKAPARFDPHDLVGLNARLLHETDFEEAATRLAKLGVGGGEAFWLAVRGNLATFAEAADWWAIATGDAVPASSAERDGDFLAAARETLPDEPWGNETWKVWTKAVREKTGRKGRELFLPLRQALTGRDAGPELALLLPFIGRERTLARLV
ncbi:MAG: glutamate--tRNA ligase [Hyphomicrobiales bacterium]|nr:MAG: glutamate--tRNA ligase [Hyphomicrobiales bacterium]